MAIRNYPAQAVVVSLMFQKSSELKPVGRTIPKAKWDYLIYTFLRLTIMSQIINTAPIDIAESATLNAGQ